MGKRKVWWGIASALCVMLVGCDPCEEVKRPQIQKKGTQAPYLIKGVWYYPQSHYHLKEEGVASYYGINDGEHNGLDAMGGTYNMHKMTAAHKTLPLPSVVQVHNLKNNRCVLVAVTDRGPFIKGRVIDVSVQAAKVLGFFHEGTAPVRIYALERESKVLTELAKNISLKWNSLSDLLPEVRKLCQNYQNDFPSSPGSNSCKANRVHLDSGRSVSLKKIAIERSKPKIQNELVIKNIESVRSKKNIQKALVTKKIYVSVAHLSFDEATWVRVQSNTFHWICSGIKKVQNSGHKPFMILLGPFLNQSQAQKVINFFKKNHMSAVVVPLS